MRRLSVDLTGKRFGRLVAMEPVSNPPQPLKWWCRCDCGNMTLVTRNSLKLGTTISCGCHIREVTSKRKLIDIAGHRYGHLTVIERASSDGHSLYWTCQCDCGKVCKARSERLRDGTTTSCGCTYGWVSARGNLVGERFGKLLVVAETDKRRKKCVVWECLCDCGNTVLLGTYQLTQDQRSSCGCDKLPVRRGVPPRDLIGQRFGRLIVLSRVSSYGRAAWNCVCDCGKEKQVDEQNLLQGTTKSCGCYARELKTTHGLSKTPEYRCYLAHQRRERERLLDVEWTFSMHIALTDFFTSCVVCGTTLQENYEKYKKSLSKDHVYPLSAGYGLYPGNAVRLCTHCNSVKHNHFPEDLPEEMRDKIMSAAGDFKLFWENEKDNYAYLDIG